MTEAAARMISTVGEVSALSMSEEVRVGLTASQKKLSPKFFYDERGSQLFDRICDTPEYYLTRTEQRLLEKHADALINTTQPNHIIEFGSGTSRKTRVILDALRHQGSGTYWPFDVSETLLHSVSNELAIEYPELKVHGLVGDYTGGLDGLPHRDGTTLALFIGSTLGNFEADEAQQFVNEIGRQLGAEDYFLLGVDLHKDTGTLEAAYNDQAGLTAAFNLNMLAVLNRELNANFDLTQFRHRAIYNEQTQQIEMYLDSLQDQLVDIGELDLSVRFAQGESLWTEVSRKWTLPRIESLFAMAGFSLVDSFVDQQFPYALALGQRLP